MKIFIQDPVTKLYLDAQNQWTPNIEAALEFIAPADALLACDMCYLKEFHLLLRFKSPDFDMTLSRAEALKLNAELEVED